VITPAKVVSTGTSSTFELSKGKQTATTSQTVHFTMPLPSLTKVDPTAGNKGSDLEMTLTGLSFYDAQPSIVFLRNGAEDKSITLSQLIIVNSTTAKATLSLKDATVGTYNVKIVIGGLESGTQPFEVKSAP
jgi:hypothetical protein